jgi:3-hydroxyisobutyrate dehydrogenase-like beta-hydroxyacid dehydrogenase
MSTLGVSNQIGLGNMGFEMALNLQTFLSSQNQNILYYNRTIERGQSIKNLGGVPASLTEIADKCSIVFFMLANDSVTKSTMAELLSHSGIKDSLLVDCSTVHPDFSVQEEKDVIKSGAQFVSCPVFGLPPVAAAARLIFVAGGPEHLVDRLRPILVPAMGRKVLYVGDQVRKALVMKLTGNSFNLGVTDLISQVCAFGESQGLHIDEITEWAKDFIGPYGELYFSRNRDGKYLPAEGQRPLLGVETAMKDCAYMLDLAKQSGSHMPTLELTKANIYKAVEMKGPNLDLSASYGYYRTLAGLDFENDFVKKRDGAN